jgi:hypothetical protein
MTSVESHKHRLAKELLAEWLAGRHNWPVFGQGRVFLEYPLCRRQLLQPPIQYKGQYHNYTHVQIDDGLEMLWDESGWNKPRFDSTQDEKRAWLETPEGVAWVSTQPPEYQTENPVHRSRVPTYEELCSIGTPPLIIADIVVSHKGHVGSCVEVVHKSDITPTKMQRYRELCQETEYYVGGAFEVWTVPADWILGQIGVPEKFAGTRLL